MKRHYFLRLEETYGLAIIGSIYLFIAIFGTLSILSLVKERPNLDMDSSNDENNSGEFKFSQNSPTVTREEAGEVKPIDLTGNAIENARVSLEEDLERIKKE